MPVMDADTSRICCIGAGYVGGPTMAMIAHKCPDITVFVVDINAQRIAEWNSDTLPIYEPGLQEIVEGCRGKNLFFTTDVHETIRKCDIIFVSVNTPTKRRGVGAGCAADLAAWELAGRTISEAANKSKIIIEKSTVPVRTAAALQRVLDSNTKGNNKFVILSNPEFLAEGTAVRDLDAPDRVLIGGPQDTIGIGCVQVLADIYKKWVPADRVLTTNLWSAELSKLVANAFLAQRVSSINSIALLCESTGADVTEVSRAIGSDSRIGPKFLNASVGFGGSCFQKDILNLVYLCRSFGQEEVASYWEHVVKMNDTMKHNFSKRIISTLFDTVRNKKIAVLGFAFKKDTGDTRETAALAVCEYLLNDGAIVNIYDPKVDRKQMLQEFADHDMQFDFDRHLITHSSAKSAVQDAHAIVVLTEWDEFKTYNYKEFYSVMTKPAFVFDGRNILDHSELQSIGFEVHCVGKAAVKSTTTPMASSSAGWRGTAWR